MKKYVRLFVLSFVIFTAYTCEKEKAEPGENDPGDSIQNFERTKQGVIDLFTDEYLGTVLADKGWTGDLSSCDAGTISEEAQEKTLKRINYFRKMAGLNGNIVFDEEWNQKCQEAALVLNVNHKLSHYPETDWQCYSDDAYEAASKSNIAAGAAGPSAITGYMIDYGASNKKVGHRRWILYSWAKVMGHGSTNTYDALAVMVKFEKPDSMPEFIAWPPKGYVPQPMAFSRWSFSVSKADFTDAIVTMTDNDGNPVNLEVIHRSDKKKAALGFGEKSSVGDNSIVWEPESIVKNVDEYTYHVKVEKVALGGEFLEYEYDVVLIEVPAQ